MSLADDIAALAVEMETYVVNAAKEATASLHAELDAAHAALDALKAKFEPAMTLTAEAPADLAAEEAAEPAAVEATEQPDAIHPL